MKVKKLQKSVRWYFSAHPSIQPSARLRSPLHSESVLEVGRIIIPGSGILIFLKFLDPGCLSDLFSDNFEIQMPIFGIRSTFSLIIFVAIKRCDPSV